MAYYLLVLDSINFGSGWFPTLRKRPGHSGYFTVVASLADHWRGGGRGQAQLRAIKAADVAAVLGQEPDHELMGLYARRCASLGASCDRRALDLVYDRRFRGALRLGMLAAGMPFFDDRGFWKRAQIAANDLALAGVAEFDDLDRLTIFADNLVPHVLRVDGVLRYEPLRWPPASTPASSSCPARRNWEIRACAVHAAELIAARTGMAARLIDTALWNKGQAPRYKSVPRRTRTVLLSPRLAAGRSGPPAVLQGADLGAAGLAAGLLGHELLELVEAVGEAADPSATGSGRWTQSASGPSGFLPSTRTGWPGLPTTVEFGGTSWITTEAPIFARSPIRIGPSSAAPAPIITSLPTGVALAACEAGAAERHALVDRHVVAHLGRLADDDARAVIDEQPSADPGRRMDLHPRHRGRYVRQHPRQQRAPQPRRGHARCDARAAPGRPHR